MTQRSAVHDTFTIERTYPAPPARVFAAWSEPDAKRRWFGSAREHELDFRVGGAERLVARMESAVYTYDARYQDIVADERIVYSYDMHRDDDRISVSLTTVELTPSGDGTLLRYTEQGVYLDGHDTAAQREHGTRELLEALASQFTETGAASQARASA
jgi:uncharacterized protein YndB with AHSA1/START domain